MTASAKKSTNRIELGRHNMPQIPQTYIKEVPVSCLYVPSTLNLKAIKHGLGVALAVVRIHLKSILHSLVRGNYA